MKKKVFSIVCMIAMLVSSLPVHASKSFTDLNSTHWAYNNIMSLVNKGVINGYEDGTYRPENMVTYGEFMKLVICSYLSDDQIIKGFPNTHWASGYVIAAEMQGFLPKGSIKNEQLDLPITRLEMVKFLAKIDENATFGNVELKEATFSDIQELPQEYKYYINYVVTKGYILGNPDNTFNPTSNLSRAEMATILTRI